VLAWTYRQWRVVIVGRVSKVDRRIAKRGLDEDDLREGRICLVADVSRKASEASKLIFIEDVVPHPWK